MTTTSCPSIVSTPGTCGGKPRIDGTRIKVRHVYVWVEQMGMSPAEIVRAYPQLSMAAIHSALAYYWSHQDEIHHEIEDEERFVASMKAKAVASTSKQKFATFQHNGDDPLPLR